MLRVNFKKIIIFLVFLLSGVIFSTISNASITTKPGFSHEWAVLDGFRSAKLGFNERSIYNAIKKDFKINYKNVSRVVHSTQKTVILSIKVKDLIPGSGPSKVFYVFGYKSKKLIHISITWGSSVEDHPNTDVVISTANQLRVYLSQKKYGKNGIVFNRQLANGTILVFQGKDEKGRMARLLLNKPIDEDGKVGTNIDLTLSYIEKPDNLDIFEIKDGDF
jgi:hypothetical protein|tara:strand:- start:186 stop:845 length:660 start_codon:yes stop_codon:yes gene_type:complete